ncbi:MBL fold metallo-hydrolase [Nocardia noduli]|uniref:MBL fold metallo-hydrolase n=1 Tax=Nocardia noduli TaxID=2815722 RepID=UPI001C22EB78|nr:MBL fold metallo-hydrolase [Nocardia noduli]
MTITSDRLTTAAGLRSIEFGDHRVTYLPDGLARLDPHLWLPDADDTVWAEYRSLVDADGYLAASVGAVMIEHGDRAMLIDAGFGPLAVPTDVGTLRGGQLLNSLAAAGKIVTDIELVAITHLHMDHIGWLWQTHPDTSDLVFAGIPILVGATEWSRRDLAIADLTPPEVLDILASRVQPLAEEEIFPGVHPIATPGHSLGHTGYVITSGGQRLIVFGDALTTPAQIGHPHLTARADDDPAQSRATAAWLIDELAQANTLGFGIHFADIQFGRVTSIGGEHRWQPE